MSIKLSLVNFLTKIRQNYSSKVLKKGGGLKFNKKNLNSWMNLTKKERFNLSKSDSMTYSIERKNLLKQIRNEYKNTIKKN
tara:strand:- start:304 stop:546 length:243 start_codon:yes stop_codon:yes gene_type:complete